MTQAIKTRVKRSSASGYSIPPIHETVIRILVNPGMMGVNAPYINTPFDPVRPPTFGSSFLFPRNSTDMQVLMNERGGDLSDAAYGPNSIQYRSSGIWAAKNILNKLKTSEPTDLLRRLQDEFSNMEAEFSSMEKGIINGICQTPGKYSFALKLIPKRVFKMDQSNLWLVKDELRLDEGMRLRIMTDVLVKVFEVFKGINPNAEIPILHNGKYKGKQPYFIRDNTLVEFIRFVLSTTEHIAEELKKAIPRN